MNELSFPGLRGKELDGMLLDFPVPLEETVALSAAHKENSFGCPKYARVKFPSYGENIIATYLLFIVDVDILKCCRRCRLMQRLRNSRHISDFEMKGLL